MMQQGLSYVGVLGQPEWVESTAWVLALLCIWLGLPLCLGSSDGNKLLRYRGRYSVSLQRTGPNFPYEDCNETAYSCT